MLFISWPCQDAANNKATHSPELKEGGGGEEEEEEDDDDD